MLSIQYKFKCSVCISDSQNDYLSTFAWSLNPHSAVTRLGNFSMSSNELQSAKFYYMRLHLLLCSLTRQEDSLADYYCVHAAAQTESLTKSK
jgi:hypothetical protein